MASTRWPSVLMLWLLLPRLRMVRAGFRKQIFKSAPSGWDSTMVVPDDGVYLVSLVVDPCEGCASSLSVYTQRHWKERYIFTAFSGGIYSHAEAAIGLRRLELLYTKTHGKVESASSFSVVYVAELSSYRVTAMNAKYWSFISPVLYTRQLTPDGWNDLKNPDKKTTFSIPTTGMYWVTGNVLPDHDKSIIAMVCNGPRRLLTLFVEQIKQVSTSGAFRLTAGSTIFMATKGGSYQTTTFLSAVYLAGNKKPNTYPFEHLAFTAKMQEKQIMSLKLVIDFKRVLTNYGYMYIEGYTEIRRTGSYMVSLRPDPENFKEMKVSLFINGKFHWTVYAQQHVPVGVTISLLLKAGSYLEVRSSDEALHGDGSMYSIAFIQP